MRRDSTEHPLNCALPRTGTAADRGSIPGFEFSHSPVIKNNSGNNFYKGIPISRVVLLKGFLDVLGLCKMELAGRRRNFCSFRGC